jgi:hypothetical protein
MVEEFSEIDSSKMLGSAPNPRPVLNRRYFTFTVKAQVGMAKVLGLCG